MSSNDNERYIHNAKMALHKAREKAGIQRAFEKKTIEQATAKLRVLLDDVKASGVDLSSDYGRAVIALCIGQVLSEDEPSSSWNTNGDRFMDI